MFKIQKSIIRILYLKTLSQVLDSTSLIKAKPLEMCSPCPLVHKVVTSFLVKLKSLPSVYFVASLINHLLTVSIDSLYSTLKVITKHFDIN